MNPDTLAVELALNHHANLTAFTSNTKQNLKSYIKLIKQNNIPLKDYHKRHSRNGIIGQPSLCHPVKGTAILKQEIWELLSYSLSVPKEA